MTAEERARLVVDEDECSCGIEDGITCLGAIMNVPEPERDSWSQWHCCLYGAAVYHLRAHAAAAVARERERIELVIVDGDWEEGGTISETLANIVTAIRARGERDG